MRAGKVTPLGLLEACLWALIALLIVPIYIVMGWNNSISYTEGPQYLGGADFKAYYVAARLAREGEDFYDQGFQLAEASALGLPLDRTFYIYPPFFALLMVPLSALPIQAAARAWFFLNLGLLGATLAILGRALEIRRLVPLWLIGALLFSPVLYTLHMGQVNIIILFLAVVAYSLLNRGLESCGGALLGVASIIKVAPAALVAYLLWKGRWRALLAALLGAGFLAVGSELVLEAWGGQGWGSWGRYLTQVLPGLGEPRASPWNQSFNGLFSLLFLSNSYFPPLVDSPALWGGMVVTCSLLLLGATIGLCPWGRRGAMDMEMALVICALLPLASLTWTSTLALLLFPYAVLVKRWLTRPHFGSIALGGVAYVMLSWPRLLEGMATWEGIGAWGLLSSKSPLLGTLLVLVAVAALVREEARCVR